MFKRKYGRAQSLNAFADRVRSKAQQARRNASETQRDSTRRCPECGMRHLIMSESRVLKFQAPSCSHVVDIVRGTDGSVSVNYVEVERG